MQPLCSPLLPWLCREPSEALAALALFPREAGEHGQCRLSCTVLVKHTGTWSHLDPTEARREKRNHHRTHSSGLPLGGCNQPPSLQAYGFQVSVNHTGSLLDKKRPTQESACLPRNIAPPVAKHSSTISGVTQEMSPERCLIGLPELVQNADKWAGTTSKILTCSH